MKLLSIFSARNVTLVVFILVVLVLGTIFNTHVGPEGMVNKQTQQEGVTDEKDVKDNTGSSIGSSIGSSLEKAMSSAMGKSSSEIPKTPST